VTDQDGERREVSVWRPVALALWERAS